MTSIFPQIVEYRIARMQVDNCVYMNIEIFNIHIFYRVSYKITFQNYKFLPSGKK